MTEARPTPILGLYDVPFWDHLAAREFRLQRCAKGHFRFPPGPVCPDCGAFEAAWVPASGRATVVTWTVFHKQYFPQMPPPYVVVCAQLEEGPLIVADIEGVAAADLAVGQPLELRYRDVLIDGEPRVINVLVRAGQG